MTREQLNAAWDAYYLGGGKERLEEIANWYAAKKGKTDDLFKKDKKEE